MRAPRRSARERAAYRAAAAGAGHVGIRITKDCTLRPVRLSAGVRPHEARLGNRLAAARSAHQEIARATCPCRAHAWLLLPSLQRVSSLSRRPRGVLCGCEARLPYFQAVSRQHSRRAIGAAQGRRGFAYTRTVNHTVQGIIALASYAVCANACLCRWRDFHGGAGGSAESMNPIP